MINKLFAFCAALLTSLAMSFNANSAQKEDATFIPEITEAYEAVSIGGEFRVIYCSPSDTLKIVAKDKVLNGVECLVEDGTLVVRYREGKAFNTIMGGRSPIVYIPANPDIRSFRLSGTTRMECAHPIVQESLHIKMSGASRVIGEVKTKHLDIYCAGTVNVTLTGSSDTTNIRIDGASRVAVGEGFECNSADLDINGAGIVRINCVGTLSGKIAGSSVVRYLGEPEVKIETNGLASITRID